MDKTFYLESPSLHITNAVDDSDFLIIEGSAAHFDVPNLNNEIVSASSFDNFFKLYKEEKKIKPTLTYNHDSNMLIGGIDDIYVDNDKLMCLAHVNKNIKFCADTLIPSILAGDTKSFSTEGFVSYEDIEERENDTYFCKSFLLTCISIVSIPADYKSEFVIKNWYEAEKALREMPKSKWYLIR